MQQYVDENLIAGAVALILQNGQPVYQHAAGWADKEAGTRMSNDTIFRIASQTKALTSVAILQLQEQGKLVVNDPVSKFIPEFAKTTVFVKNDAGGGSAVPATRAITLRDLLTHTAGISYGTQPEVASLYAEKALGPNAGMGWYTADKNEQTCTTMERLASLPFVAQPGASFVYGYNTDILGCVVERASGMPLDEYFRTNITQPLGMKDTNFFLPKDQRGRLAAVYLSGPNGKIVRATNDAKGQGHYVDGPRKNFAGGAGLLSTATDYARFMEALRNGGALGGVRILSPRSVALMTTNQVGDIYNKRGMGFGLGFETVESYGASGLEAPGTFGWGGAYGTNYRVDPSSGLVVVLMIQLMPNNTDFREKFANLVYQSLLPQ
jgi:CubicO group peptidase (beta-lactamase class C family)